MSIALARFLAPNPKRAKTARTRLAARVLTKYRKNEALIRNDGVYVISGIFCGAHEGRALCAKQAEVSPVSNKSHKHALRAMWIDDCELWVKMHSRPDRWPLEAAKRLEARAHAVRSAGTLGRRRRHSAKTSGRADSLANQRFVNDQTARTRLADKETIAAQ